MIRQEQKQAVLLKRPKRRRNNNNNNDRNSTSPLACRLSTSTSTIISSILSKVSQLLLSVFFILLPIIIIITTTTTTHVTTINAYPTGAGSCIGGKPAVLGTQHVNPLLHSIIRNGTLSDVGILVEVKDNNDNATNNSILLLQPADGTATTTTITTAQQQQLYTNTNYTISVIGTSYEYKGILLRLQGTTNDDLVSSDALEPGSNTRSASDVCAEYGTNVIGITHSDGTIFKKEHTGFIQMINAGIITIDITVVAVSNATATLYAYDQFVIEFIEDQSNTAPTSPQVPTTPTTTTKPVITVPAPIFVPSPTLVSITTPEPSSLTTALPTTAPTSKMTELPTSIAPIPQPPIPLASVNTTTTAPTIIPTTVAPSSTDHNTSPSECAYPTYQPTIDITNTISINEIISNVEISYENVNASVLSVEEIRSIEILTEQWFNHFFNYQSNPLLQPLSLSRISSSNLSLASFLSSSSNTTNAVPLATEEKITTAVARNNNDDVNRRLRRLQSTSPEKETSSITILPPEAYVIPGTMDMVMEIIHQKEASSSSNNKNDDNNDPSSTNRIITLTYNQQLKYRIHTNDSPFLPTISNTSTTKRYKPLTPNEYAILPFESESANSEYVQLLQTNMSSLFSNLSSPIAVPQIIDDNAMTDAPISKPDEEDSNDIFGFNPILFVAMIIGGTIVCIYVLLCMKKSIFTKKDQQQQSGGGTSSSGGPNAANTANTNSGGIASSGGGGAGIGILSDHITSIQSKINIPLINRALKPKVTETAATTTTTAPPPRRRTRTKMKSEDFNYNDDASSVFDVGSQYTTGSIAHGDYSVAGNAFLNKSQDNLDLNQSSISSGAAAAATGSGDVAAGVRNDDPTQQFRRNAVRPQQLQGQQYDQTTTSTLTSSATDRRGPPDVTEDYSAFTMSSPYGKDADNDDEYIVLAPAGKLGIVVDNPEDDSGPIIYAIKETSPLLDSEINVGDRLIAVDEVNVTRMSPALISKLISKRSSNAVRRLRLVRSDEDMTNDQPSVSEYE